MTTQRPFKPWPLSTTVRHPERLGRILSAFAEMEVVGFGGQVQDVLHVGYEVGVYLGNAPLRLLRGFKQILLECSRTVSWDCDGANPNSTTLPASSRRARWLWPSSAGLPADAIRACPALDTGWASPLSSSFRHRWARDQSWSAPSRPASANRHLIRQTVPSTTCRTWSTSGAGQPWSLLSKMRARVTTRAVPLLARTRCSHWPCCSAFSRTSYYSPTIPPPLGHPIRSQVYYFTQSFTLPSQPNLTKYKGASSMQHLDK